MIKQQRRNAKLEAAIALVSKRYAEEADVDVVAVAYEVADDFDVTPQEILSCMGKRGGLVAARNRRRMPRVRR